jgi:hypothetical protein
VVHVPPGPLVLFEVEPNDSIFQPNLVGELDPYEDVRIRGFIDDSGFDPFDGFLFEVDGPSTIEVVLRADWTGADLDVCAIDDWTGLEIACFQSPHDPEVGSFTIAAPLGAAFHLAVNSFLGASAYSLDVVALPLALATSAEEPAAAPDPARAGRFRTYVAPARGATEADDEPLVRRGLWIEHDADGRPIRVREALVGERDVVLLD